MGSYINFLKRNKAYTAIDVLGLALSMMLVVLIGGYAWQEQHVNTQYPMLDRIYMIAGRTDNGMDLGTNWRVQHRMRSEYPEILSTVGLRRVERNLLNPANEEVSTTMMLTDTTFTDFFNIELKEGDWRTAIADRNSVVISEDFARKAFGGVNAMGQTLRMNDTINLHVAGIMEPIINSSIAAGNNDPIDMIGRFELMEFIDWWAFSPGMNQIGGTDILLLAPEGVDLSENLDKYKQFMNSFADEANGIYFNQFSGQWGYDLEILPFKDFYMSSWNTGNLNRADNSRINVLIVAGIVILIFALMNYVNLTVALSSRRAKEMATRRLLGDSRSGIMMRLIGEATALCFVALAIGVALAFVALPYASHLIGAPINLVTCFTPATIAVLIGITLLMGVTAGIIPAVLISASKPIDVVRGTYRRRSKMVFSKVFIVVQNLITIVMIAATITVYLQFRHLVDAPLGYDHKHVMVMPIPGDKSQASALEAEIRSLPSVEMLSKASSPIMGGGHNNTITIKGNNVGFQIYMADSSFFAVNGFEPESDNHSVDGYFVNHTLLNTLDLKEDAQEFPYIAERPEKIRGVIPDLKMGTVQSGTRPMLLMIDDVVNNNWGFVARYFLIRVNGDEAETYRQVQQLYLNVTGKMPYNSSPYQEQMIESAYGSTRSLGVMIGVFALVALMISVLGLVAMSTFFVQQRAMEIAVRKVHGATSASVIARTVRPFMMYVLIAFLLAVPLIYDLMNELLSSYNYRIHLYWWIYLCAGLVCAITSFVSVLWQTSKAAAANPVKALTQNG